MVTGYGPIGNVLWKWYTTEYYDVYGGLVYHTDTWTAQETYWGWSYLGSNYSYSGQYSTMYRSTSTGYFSGPNGQSKYGRINFTIYGSNGHCDVSGSSGDW